MPRSGDVLELVPSADDAAAFTLVSVGADDEDIEAHGMVKVRGQLSAISDGSIRVHLNHALPVTCAVPAETDLSAFKAGDNVEMNCALVDNQLTLMKLKSEDDDDDH